MENIVQNQRKESLNFFKTRTGKRLIFYILICALPVLQFCIFTLYVNFNSIVMAFEKYDYAVQGQDEIVKSFAGFENFRVAWETISQKGYMFTNAFWLFLSGVLITTPLALIFSFYLCKKCALSGFFRVILYMPNIISPMIFALLFQRIVNWVIPSLFNLVDENGAFIQVLSISQGSPSYGVILFFNIWVSFGVNVLMFTGAMSGINASVVESAQLDGAGIVEEFWYITIPMIFSTISTFFVLGMTGIFTNQMHLYTFFGFNASGIETIGYFLYATAQRSGEVLVNAGSWLTYPQLAALGLILTVFVAPITFLTRKLLDKYGPSED